MPSISEILSAGDPELNPIDAPPAMSDPNY